MSSSMNFHRNWIVMMGVGMLLMGFIISASSTLTFLAAFNTRAKALAVILSAF
jgi:hypothetical protein